MRTNDKHYAAWEANNKPITKSAGLVVIQDNKILLVHPSNAPWYGTYSIPKGHIDEGEDTIDAAIRETFEEVGLTINKNDVSDINGITIYSTEKGEIFKKVYYFVVYLPTSVVIDKFDLQLAEVDYAGFLTKEEAQKRIFGRFKPLLDLLI